MPDASPAVVAGRRRVPAAVPSETNRSPWLNTRKPLNSSFCPNVTSGEIASPAGSTLVTRTVPEVVRSDRHSSVQAVHPVRGEVKRVAQAAERAPAHPAGGAGDDVLEQPGG